MKKRDYKSEVLDIIKTKDWDRAKVSNDKYLYNYICRHRDIDKNCKIIWEHIRPRDYKSEVLEIIETKDWDRAKWSNDENLHNYVKYHKDIDENCKIIWEHVRRGDYKSEVIEIIRTKDWDRARYINNKYLYKYIFSHKDTDENCRTIRKHIVTEKHCPYTVKDYLLDYFKHEKLENRSLYQWFTKEIKNSNQSCIDVKNLIIAAETYKDPVALETLELIKNHLEKEGM